MEQDREIPHSASAPGLFVAPRRSLESEISAQRHALENVPVSSKHPAEANSSSSTRDQSTSAPVILAPAPLALNSGNTAAIVTPSFPASGSDGSLPRSIRRNPLPQTSLTFEEGAPELRRALPLPPLPPEVRVRSSRIGFENPLSSGPRSGIDYIVPVDEKITREKTVGERLQPTLLTAIAERDKYASKAKLTAYTLNIAIGLQVILGALTTALGSVAASSHQTAIATAVLGGLSTLTASYLARARGSNEPELSISKVKDMEQFIRQCEAFQMDYGHKLGNEYDKEIKFLRNRLEELGNADGQRRLAPPV